MPCLDLEIWMGVEQRSQEVPKEIPGEEKAPCRTGQLSRVVLYSFYRKPMNRRNAAPERTMLTTASNEYLRRYRNVSRDLPITEIERVKSALKVVTVGYLTKLEKNNNGGTPIYRPGNFDWVRRSASKLLSKTTWFQYKNTDSSQQLTANHNSKPKSNSTQTAKTARAEREKQPETVLFIPHTPGSNLKKQVQEKINRGKKYQNVRVVERQGPKVGSLIINPAPWRREACLKPSCTPCEEKPGSCRARNCVYKITCLLCMDNGLNTLYIGETHRTWGDREADHQKALEDSNTEYGIVKHHSEHHTLLGPSFKYEGGGTCFKSSIERHIMEALMIQNTPRDITMNRKSEWVLNYLPQLVASPRDTAKGISTSNSSNNIKPAPPKPPVTIKPATRSH